MIINIFTDRRVNTFDIINTLWTFYEISWLCEKYLVIWHVRVIVLSFSFLLTYFKGETGLEYQGNWNTITAF